MTGRGKRESILILQRKQNAKRNKDGKATGLGGEEPPEFELLIEEIVNISKDKRRTTKEKFQIMQRTHHWM